MFIGVDVGGTNTDAVLMDGARLVGAAKAPTTADVTSGIVASVSELLAQNPRGAGVDAVMVGTTHFTNALLERRNLAATAVIRLCLPATQLLPPLVDWPEQLRDAVGGFTCMVAGGHEFDGREISPLDRDELRKTARELRSGGVGAVALSGVFSLVNPAHENEAAAIIREEVPDMRVCLSHENGRMGLLERENAAALNACLGDMAALTITGIGEALKSLGINAPLFMSQNDGTLMDTEFASRFPVLTISSGPTNSMRGAAWLSGVRDGIVVDVGGTSTDVGSLVRGFPREAAVAIRLAGVRTNFRMPDMVSIPLGGGSIVLRQAQDEELGRTQGERLGRAYDKGLGQAPSDGLSIGPESVGYRLTEEALVFGGDTLTATDLAVAAGRARVGDPARVQRLERPLVEAVTAEIRARVETAIDRVKLSGGNVPVVLVGGGSILLGDELAGASDVLRPQHADVANAIGAAIAQVGGQVERVYSLEQAGREEAIADCSAAAIGRAVSAGAAPETVEVVEIDEVPLAYVPSNATLVRVKAVGELASPSK